MKNKYSELSNFEINKLIADKNGYKYVCNDKDGSILVESISSGYGGFKTIILTKNYCYYFQDIFKLMIENKISLRYINLNGKWEAIGGIYSDRLTGKSINTTSVNENPCRAIAECYLLIKDAENGQKLR